MSILAGFNDNGLAILTIDRNRDLCNNEKIGLLATRLTLCHSRVSGNPEILFM
jgi:hypothetical protein